MLVSLLSALVVSGTPEPGVVVLVSRRTALSTPDGAALADQVSTQLAQAGVPLSMDAATARRQLLRLLVTDSASCAGKKVCLAELGRQLEAPFVVGLSVAALNKEVSIGLELLRVSDGSVLHTHALMLARIGAIPPEHLTDFARRVIEMVSPARSAPPTGDGATVASSSPVAAPTNSPPPRPDAAPGSRLAPGSGSTEGGSLQVRPEVPPSPPASRSHTTSWVLGGVGVAAMVASGALLASAVNTRATLTQGSVAEDGRIRSGLTGAQALRANDTASILAGSAAGAAAVGVGVGIMAVVMW